MPECADAGDRITVAYEPIWAIGSGRTPTTEEIAAIHAAIRVKLVELYGDAALEVRILYGGSVKPDNAAELLSIAEVGGALVGGASLSADNFVGIVVAAVETIDN